MESGKPSESEGDSWYGVHDPRKRKRIQDRLAQRARRKRLASGIKKAKQLQDSPSKALKDQENKPDAVTNLDETISMFPTDSSVHLSTLRIAESHSRRWFPEMAMSTNSLSPSPRLPITPQAMFIPQNTASFRLSSPRDHSYLRTPRSDLIVALGICGSFLGLACGVHFVRSRRHLQGVPEILQPTPLQLTTPHYSWIDRWPFPRMRDNMILLAHMINMEELFADSFEMETFTLLEGAAPWDPSGWRISPQFRAKWGYLFH